MDDGKESHPACDGHQDIVSKVIHWLLYVLLLSAKQPSECISDAEELVNKRVL